MPEKNQPPAASRQNWKGFEVRGVRELPGALEQSRRLEALAHLSGEVAHDVNNALQVIQNAVEILRRRLPSAEAEVTGLVDMLARNSNRASSLMLRLLAFSGRLPLEPRAVDANHFIAGIAVQLREATGTGAIAVETVLGDGVWGISADPDRLRAAMLSLTTNGQEAMPRGGTLTIESGNVCIDKSTMANGNRVPPGEYVSIIVRDNGTGMTPEVVSKVFDPYFTTKETGYGTGLGLSQVYGFMKQSNGYIDINSSPGSGTSVTLFFPRIAVA